MQPMKEAATNVAASAKAGMDKTKATVQEKVEKMTAHDPMQKEMATQKKEERITQAELNKQQAREAAKQHGTGTGTGNGMGHTATGGTYGTEGYPTGAEAYGSGAHQTGYGTGTHSYSTTGTHGHPTGGHQMSALPGHGTGQPTGQVTEGTVGSHPIGANPGTGGTRAHNTHVGGGGPAHGTGGSYS